MSIKSDNSNQHSHFSNALISSAYVGTVLAANYAVMNIGFATGSGVHTIPVFPGIDAPSGVLFAGVAFTLRDIVQDRMGKAAVIICIGFGAALSALVSTELAAASAVAFLVSEFIDFIIYTLMYHRSRIAAVATSNLFGLVIDSLLFLSIAGIPMIFLPGQIIGKFWMTVLAVIILWVSDRKSRQSSEMN